MPTVATVPHKPAIRCMFLQNLVFFWGHRHLRRLLISDLPSFSPLPAKVTCSRLRVSILSALCEGKLIAPLTFEGSCSRLVFEKWLSEQLLPELKPGQTIILDNATFHKGKRIKDLVESVGCEVQYLPTYSPDLNKIEPYWFPIKNRVRKSKGTIDNFRERVDSAIRLTS